MILRNWKRTSVAAALMMTILGIVNAGPFEEGIAAVERGDNETAFRLWRPLAEQGISEAQYNIGFMYFKGWGVQQDYTEASRWFSRAAQQDNADAQFFLGLSYSIGRGVPQDPERAVHWYRKAAEQGDVVAQFNLGVIYDKGRHTGQRQVIAEDDSEAIRWYRRAAQQGYSMAQMNLALIYMESETVPRNDIEAYKWLSIAGDTDARELRDRLSGRMSKGQLAEAGRLEEKCRLNRE
jgi:TPR repeat protein